MNSQDAIKIIKTLTGFDVVISPKSRDVLIIQAGKGEDRKELLRRVAEHIDGARLVAGNALKASAKCSKGGVIIGNLTVIAKEVINGKTVSQLDARTFTTGAKIVKINYNGEDISCYSWTTYKAIEQSIIDGCRKEPMLGAGVAETFEDFFKSGVFHWGKVDPEALLMKLGVYVGELLSGWVVLKEVESKFIEGTHPFKGQPAGFYIPDDPSFKGVDSLIQMKTGEFVAISSKFDRGAAASLIGNVLPGAMKKFSSLKPCTLKTLADICKKKSINPERSAIQ